MRVPKIMIVIIFCLLSAAPLIAESVALQKAGSAVPPSNTDQYMGSDTCAECHADLAAKFKVTAHRRILNGQGPPDLHGCEACHGPAKKHVEYYQGAQRLLKEGKDEEATRLYADETLAAAARML